MGPCSHDDVSTLFHESCVALRVASMLFEGGGRGLREAGSIRPPPGRRRVGSGLAVPSDRRRSLSGLRGDTVPPFLGDAREVNSL